MKSRVATASPSKAPADGVKVSIQHSEQSFQGPIPPPVALEGYERVVPGAAERILRMAEQEALHRQALEVEAMRANAGAGQRQLDLAQAQLKAVYASDKLGQWLGFAVSMACLAGGIYLGATGQPWLGGVLVTLPIAGVIRALREQGPRPAKSEDAQSK